jgi:hypothetical protein
MLSNILYGTAVLNFGGVRLSALAGGRRGESVTLTVAIDGSVINVSVTIRALGTGDILVTAPTDTTEAQLINALKAVADLRKLASVEQASGDGSESIEALPKTSFSPATGGFRQLLQARTGITIWEDRDRIATGKTVGFLEIFEAKIEKEVAVVGAFDRWSGVVVAGLAFQQDIDFESQNVTLDLYRRGLYYATKLFTHDDLVAIGPDVFGYTNVLKSERVGTTSEGARLEVIGRLPIVWREPAFDPDDADEFPFDHFQVALWREPVADIPGPGGGEVRDTVITLE